MNILVLPEGTKLALIGGKPGVEVTEFRAGTATGLRVSMELGKPCVLSVPVRPGDPK